MILPFMAKKEKIDTESIELEPLYEFAFDFEKNDFKLRDGKQYLVYGNEALEIWIHKSFKTERFKFLAYSKDFGSELENLIGTSLNIEEKKSEVKRLITECLMVNPYIKSVDSIEMVTEDSFLKADITLTSIYGRMKSIWKQTL